MITYTFTFKADDPKERLVRITDTEAMPIEVLYACCKVWEAQHRDILTVTPVVDGQFSVIATVETFQQLTEASKRIFIVKGGADGRKIEKDRAH